MNKKFFLVFSFLFLFSVLLLSNVSAVNPVSQVQQFPNGYTIIGNSNNYLTQGQDYEQSVFIYNSTDGKLITNLTTTCRFFLANSQGFNLYAGNMIYQPWGGWSIYINGSNFSYSGYYDRGVNCQDGLGGTIQDVLTVTPTGLAYSDKPITAEILILLFFAGLILLTYYIKNKIDFERWYNKMQTKYENKNFIKLSFSIIAYNIMTNVFVIYYIIGLGFMTVLYDISFTYNLTAILPTMKILMFIYSWSVILVGLVFLSKIQEWVTEWIKDIQNNNWGFGK